MMIFLFVLGLVFYLLWFEKRKIIDNLTSFSKQEFRKTAPIFAFLMIVVLVFMLQYGGNLIDLKNIYLNEAFDVFGDIIMAVFGWMTIGEKIPLFFEKTSLESGLAIFCTYIVGDACILSILPFKDPQGLDNIHLSKEQMIPNIIGTVSVGIGEEILKLTLIVGVFVVLCKLFNSKRTVLVLYSGLIASFVFGMMHSFGWNVQSGIALGVSSIISTLLIIFFRNIWIPMLAHISLDASQVLDLYNHGREQPILVTICMVTTLFLIYRKRQAHYKSKRDVSRSV